MVYEIAESPFDLKGCLNIAPATISHSVCPIRVSGRRRIYAHGPGRAERVEGRENAEVVEIGLARGALEIVFR